MMIKKEIFIELENVSSKIGFSKDVLLCLDNYPKCHIVSKQDTILKRRLKKVVNNQPVPDGLEDSIQEFIQK